MLRMSILDEIRQIPADEQSASASGFLQPKGCSICNSTGYQGRLGIFEIIEINEEIRSKIIAGEPVGHLWKVLRKQGVRTLRQDGLIKAQKGLTSLEEIIRLTAQH